jgi:glutathione S-transferase
MLALPSMLDWNRAALVEPWRDEEHEVDASVVGTLLEDLRAPRSPR